MPVPGREPPVVTVSVPPSPVLSLAEVRAHLRVDVTDEDALITGMIAAATADIDGPDGWLGRALGRQTLVLTAAHFPGTYAGLGWDDIVDWQFGAAAWSCRWRVDEIRLPCPPVQSIESVAYIDPAGARQTLDAAFYSRVDRYLFPVPGQCWPVTTTRPDAVRITYVAGYDDGKLPAQIRAALLLKVGSLYAVREDAAAPAETASARLLAPLRVFA